MSRIDELNLKRYTQNLKAYIAHSLNEVTVATFDIKTAKTWVSISNLSPSASIDWGDGTIDTLNGHEYETAKVYTCKIYNTSKIGDSAFFGNTELISIVIGSTVKEIGKNAFQSTSLKSVVIPESVTTMGNNIFNGLDTLETVVFNAKGTNIPTGTFRNCTALTSISIPKHITTIGSNAFNGCNALTSIVIPKSITTIGANAFYGCTALTIYCEVEEENVPSGWDSAWSSSNRSVVWGYFENKEQVEKLIDEAINGALEGSY